VRHWRRHRSTSKRSVEADGSIRAVAKTVLAVRAPAAVAKGVDVELGLARRRMIEGSPGLLGALVRSS
jgi:hypothetical protein